MLLGFRIKNLQTARTFSYFGYTCAMRAMIRLCLGTIFRLFRCRRALLLENLALRQQLVVFKRRHPRPRLGLFDKMFWVTARRIWSDWKNSLIVVTPEKSLAGIGPAFGSAGG